MKVKLEGLDLANKVGTYTYLKILWKSWEKELPPSYKQIFVIIKLKKGYYPVTAEFMDPEHFQVVKFDDFTMPDIYLGTEDAKMLIAWGVLETDKNASKSR